MLTLRRICGVAICLMAATALLPIASHATTIDVLPGGSVGVALDAAAAGDTILVQCGTYQEQGLEMVAGVTLRSTSGEPDCVRLESDGTTAILICATLGGVTRIEGITFALMEGATVAPAVRGGGLMVSSAAPLVSQCVFDGLRADYGGAVYCKDGAIPTFSGCTFVGNSARAVGGAVNCTSLAAPIFASCLFFDNWTDGWGAVVNVTSGAAPHFVACTIADNGDLGYNPINAIGWDGGAAQLTNSIVTGDTWWGDTSAVPQITCSNLFGGDASAWSGLLADQAGPDGNISADPLFCRSASSGAFYALDELSPCAATQSACGQMGAYATACAVSGVEEPELPEQVRPTATRLRGNFPNPFNPSTLIRYEVKQAGPVDIAVFDLAGRLVKRLVVETRNAGAHEVRWHGVDHTGKPVAAGVYFVRLKAGADVDTDRLSLIK